MPQKILIADDDVETLRLIGLMLQRQGFEIAAATNGAQALDMSRNGSPDLIILDVMMPDMDGYQVTRQLRQDPGRSREILGRIPAGRWGEPSDVGGTAVFLASPAADYLHGAISPVDGGWLAR